MDVQQQQLMSAASARRNPLYAMMESSGGANVGFWQKGGGGRNIVYGGISGAIEMTINMPWEYIKTYMQLYPQRAPSMLVAARSTVQQFGVTGLWRGLAPMLLFSIPKSGVRFGVAESMRDLVKGPDGKVSGTMNAVAGLLAGVAEAVLVVTPQETMKVRLINDRLMDNPRFHSSADGIRTIIREQGLSGVYKGLTTTILKQGSNQMIRFFAFYRIKNFLLAEGEKDFDLFTFGGFMKNSLCGILAGAASVVGNTPIDVVKTKMQGLESNQYRNSWDCTVKTFREGGPLAFYKGVMPRMMRVSLDVMIVMNCFAYIKKLMDDLLP